MHPWRLGFGSVVMAVSAVTWITRVPASVQPGARGFVLASAGRTAPAAVGNARCSVPARDGGAAPLLTPLEPQVLPSRTVVLVDSPVALASNATPHAH